MKKIILTILICFFTLNVHTVAQTWGGNDDDDDTIRSTDTNPYERDFIINPYKNSFYWYLPPLYYQTFQVGYERFIVRDFKRRSIFGSLGIILGSERLSSKDGFSFEGQYRLYFDQAHEKIDLYGAPYFQFDNVEIQRKNEDAETVSSFSGGLVMGAKLFVFRQGIIELQVGGGFRKSNTPEDSQEAYDRVKAWEFGYTGVFGRGTVAVGFAF